MALKNFQLLVCCSLFFVRSFSFAQTNKNNLAITSIAAGNNFPIFSNTITPIFYYDSKDAKVVQIAAEAFANDINLISGKQIKLNSSNKIEGEFAIIAGTIGHSALIDDLIKARQINVIAIKDKWEQFSITVINQPYKNAKKILAITGSDRRGTAFGIFHVSRLMGISPFVWWADVLPEKKQELFVSGSYVSAAPSVQYRGIFINDEDWGLQPWAAKNMDTVIKDIGPKTYAKVFELLLRLKANYIWPAMHPCTKAFYYYKQNPKVADDYAIVVGGSHCEPMLRNNVCEWAETYEEEYKKKPGEWRYDLNKDEIYKYWDDRIKESVNYESVFTVGMRGVHDGSMPGPKDPNEKVKLLEKVITDQREILQNNFKKSSTSIPQIFVPYKEVLSLYRRGMQLADDVTIIWPDDNHGYIRQLPNEEEQKRTGGHGVYYHLSYWGSPADYLWLSSTSPALIGYEMKKAYDYGAKKLWVFNVGDIKPAELETQFALDMAWDISTYNAADPAAYIQKWAGETFGMENANQIAKIKEDYYQLANKGKPEHLDLLSFSKSEIISRKVSYAKMLATINNYKKKRLQYSNNAFYQLIEYPVAAASFMCQKVVDEKMAAYFVSKNQIDDAKNYLQYSRSAFDSIKAITEYYNTVMSAGKWNGMMSWHPRDLKTFNPPLVFDSLSKLPITDIVESDKDDKNRVYKIGGWDILMKNVYQNCTLIKALGISGYIITPTNFDSVSALINYTIDLPEGRYKIIVKCLPTFAMEKEKQLSYTIAINNELPQMVNVHTEAESAIWKKNVIRGYSQGQTEHTIISKGSSNLKVIFKNKNLAISQIEIYKTQ